eukprot:COSAG01_NODE_1843_length_9071_cov_527.289122_1_plen_296_part_10
MVGGVLPAGARRAVRALAFHRAPATTVAARWPVAAARRAPRCFATDASITGAAAPGGVASKLFLYGGGSAAAAVAVVKLTDLGGLYGTVAGSPAELAFAWAPAYVAGVAYMVVAQPGAVLAALPQPLVQTLLAVDEVRAKRPASFVLAGGLLLLAGAWFASSMKDYKDKFSAGMFSTGGGGPAPGSDLVEIELDEVEKHNTPESMWIAVDGKVYDVTKYAPQHPGASGPDILKKVAGTDATNGFKKAGHSPKAMGLRDGLYIGELKRNLKSELAKVLRSSEASNSTPSFRPTQAPP